MKLSRGIALACGLAALSLGMAAAPAAFADSPVHEMDEFSGEESLPAGTVCDFDYLQTFTLGINAIIFGDPADPSRSIEHASFTITHTNLDTALRSPRRGSSRFRYRPRTRSRRGSASPGTCETRAEGWSCSRPGSCSPTPTPARSSSSRQTCPQASPR